MNVMLLISGNELNQISMILDFNFIRHKIIEELNNVSKDEIEDTKEPDELIDVPSTTEVFHGLEVAFKML